MRTTASRPIIILVLGTALAGCAVAPRPLALRRVVLHQNGIGYFERTGALARGTLALRLRAHEVDDVLKTLAVIDRRTGQRLGAVSATVPPRGPGHEAADKTVTLELRVGEGGARDLLVAYAVPTPAWRAAYRLVLPATEGPRSRAVLQAWAKVDNMSGEDWSAVALRLDTSTPLSFAADLRTPQFVPRPDATGQLVSPVARAVVMAERARPGDADGDGVQDTEDACVGEAEDRDGFEDDDGCVDADNDKDRILDRDDKCPNEPETYNGYQDEDGCPDKGRVIVHRGRIEILDKIYFARGSDRVKRLSHPILDAAAATLKGNPQIRVVAVQGHAADDEDDPWGLSARRAGNVRAYLLGKGVRTDLKVQAFGATQLVSRQPTEDGRSRNRRVEFAIRERDDGPGSRGDDGEKAAGEAAAASAPAAKRGAGRALPTVHGGGASYSVAGGATVKRGTSALVSVLTQQVAAEEVLLFRPDPAVEASDRHPFRAARVRNDSGAELVPGTVAIFTRGSFAGEGLMEQLHPGETVFIPYAVDGSTTLEVERGEEQLPARLIAVADGVARVEDRARVITRYVVSAGARPPARLFIKHARQHGHAARGLPPRTEAQPGAYLMPIPLAAGQVSVLRIVEERPVRREITVLEDEDAGRIALYLDASELPAAVDKPLRQLLERRRRAALLEQRIEQLREELGDLGTRAGELRRSLAVLAKARGGAALRRTLISRLKEAVEAAERVSRELSTLTAERLEARAQLREAITALRFGDARK